MDIVYLCPIYTSKVSTQDLDMFSLCDNPEVFSNIAANTPDVVVIDEGSRELLILEVGCTFDYSLEEAYLTKILKYQQLKQTISQLGYKCTLLVFIFGSLGHVHKLVVRGLQPVIVLLLCYYW